MQPWPEIVGSWRQQDEQASVVTLPRVMAWLGNVPIPPGWTHLPLALPPPPTLPTRRLLHMSVLTLTLASHLSLGPPPPGSLFHPPVYKPVPPLRFYTDCSAQLAVNSHPLPSEQFNSAELRTPAGPLHLAPLRAVFVAGSTPNLSVHVALRLCVGIKFSSLRASKG